MVTPRQGQTTTARPQFAFTESDCTDSDTQWQMKQGAQLVLMDRTGGADAIAVARNICQLSRRKAYVVAVRPSSSCVCVLFAKDKLFGQFTRAGSE